jgi:hypothetical protein
MWISRCKDKRCKIPCGKRAGRKTPLALGDFVFFPVFFIFWACIRVIFSGHLRFLSHSELRYGVDGEAPATVRPRQLGGPEDKGFETLSTRNLVVLWSTGWNNMPRVLIVGDSTIFRRSLRTVLALCDGW